MLEIRVKACGDGVTTGEGGNPGSYATGDPIFLELEAL